MWISLACELRSICDTPEFHMELPSRGDFLDADLAGDRQEEVDRVEK
jgi:hypothetical protein